MEKNRVQISINPSKSRIFSAENLENFREKSGNLVLDLYKNQFQVTNLVVVS